MIKIMSDSTCDLSQEIVKKYDISIVPLTIHIENKAYKDRIDITPDELYNRMEGLNESLSTSMPSPTEYIKIINEAVEDGYTEILCICMSSGTSGTYQSAVLAREYFFEKNQNTDIKIYIVDSKCMSHGSGWLVLKSAKLLENGASFEELIEFNEMYKTNVKHFLSVDDLDHLIRSGRLTNVSGFLGKLLNIKPIMSMKNGRGAIVGKERGLKKVLKHYVDEFVRRNNTDLTDFIIIGYTSDETIAQNLKNKLIKDTDFTGDIFIMQMGVAVGTHVGLGAVSMFFMEKKDKEDHGLMHEVHELMEKKDELLEKILHKKS